MSSTASKNEIKNGHFERFSLPVPKYKILLRRIIGTKRP